LKLLRRWLLDPHPTAALFPEQCKQQCQNDTDDNGSNNGKVESEILFSDDDVSRKSTHPRNFFSKEQEKTNQNKKYAYKNEHLAKEAESNHLKYLQSRY